MTDDTSISRTSKLLLQWVITIRMPGDILASPEGYSAYATSWVGGRGIAFVK